MTTEQRIEVYEKVLDFLDKRRWWRINRPKDFDGGLCSIFSTIGYYLSFSASVDFPEVFMLKMGLLGERRTISGYWWKPGRIGPRYRFMKKVLKMAKTNIKDRIFHPELDHADTVKFWLNTLKNPYRLEALNNARESGTLNDKATGLISALFRAFSWVDSPQGVKYWSDVMYKIIRLHL